VEDTDRHVHNAARRQTVYRSRTPCGGRDLQFGPLTILRQDRGLCRSVLFVMEVATRACPRLTAILMAPRPLSRPATWSWTSANRTGAFRFLIRDRDAKVHPCIRRGPDQRGPEKNDDPAADAAGELLRREMDTHSTSRVHRPDAHLRLGHLRSVLREYASHYNWHRPHQPRQQRPPDQESQTTTQRTQCPQDYLCHLNATMPLNLQ
jgi:hypothetical protein